MRDESTNDGKESHERTTTHRRQNERTNKTEKIDSQHDNTQLHNVDTSTGDDETAKEVERQSEKWEKYVDQLQMKKILFAQIKFNPHFSQSRLFLRHSTRCTLPPSNIRVEFSVYIRYSLDCH